MSYKQLKQDTLSFFLKVKHMKEYDLKKKNVIQSEVLDDLMRFMVFFEELETKEKNKDLKKSEHVTALKSIKKYLSALHEMID